MSKQTKSTRLTLGALGILGFACFVGIAWFLLSRSLGTCRSLDILLKRSNCQEVVSNNSEVAFSDDQTILVGYRRDFSFTIRNLRKDTTRTLDLTKIDPTIPQISGTDSPSILLSPNGRYIVTSGDRFDYGNYILLVDTEPTHLSVKKLFFTTEDHYSAKRLSFSKDGKTLAGLVGDSVMFWNIPEGDELGGFEVSRCGNANLVCQVKYAPDGIHVAITYPAETGFEIWDIRDKTRARLEYKYTDPDRLNVQSLNYSPDGKIAAIVSEGQGNPITITFFDVEARKIVKRFTLSEKASLDDHVSFSPDGALYAIITCDQVEIRRVADHAVITTVLPLWDNTPFAYYDCMLYAQITPDNQSVYYGWDGGGLVKWKLP